MSPEGDPRRELVDRLIEHERFKNAAEMLYQKRIVEEAMWSNPTIGEFAGDEELALNVTVFDLVKTFQSVLARMKDRPQYEVTKEETSVPDMVRYLRQRLEQLRPSDRLSVTELFEKQKTRRAMICLLLAILELVKRQAVELTQGESFGDIVLQRHEAYDQAFVNPGELAAVDRDYQ
jgi:segregation and condensation protein A